MKETNSFKSKLNMDMLTDQFLVSMIKEQTTPIVQDIEKALAAIDNASSILISGHIRPDGDSVGSTNGLLNTLRAAGKIADIVKIWDLPSQAEFLNPEAGIEWQEIVPEKYDLLIVVDTSSPDRFLNEKHKLLEKFKSNSKPVLVIDHHGTNSKFGSINLVSHAPSTTYLITLMLMNSHLPLTKEAFKFLFFGFVTDTGGFAFSLDNPESIFLMLKLANHYDLDPWFIYRKAVREKPYTVMKFVSEATISTKLITPPELPIRTAICSVPPEMLERYNLKNEAVAALPSHINLIQEADIAVVMSAEEQDIIVSFRSKETDVQKLAVELGGGGHLRASGTTIKNSTLQEAEEKIKKAIRKLYS